MGLPIMMHPMPKLYWSGNKGDDGATGYYWAPLLRKKRDPQLFKITAVDTFEARYVRLVGGWEKNGKWDRGPDSCITLDTLSIGIPHMWAGYIPEQLEWFLNRYPRESRWAWGDYLYDMMKDPNELEYTFVDASGEEHDVSDKYWHLHEVFCEKDLENLSEKDKLRPFSDVIKPVKGFDYRGTWNEKMNPFISGFYEIARHPSCILWQAKETIGKPKGLLKEMKQYGWDQEVTLALIGRMANSRGKGGVRSALRKIVKRLGTKDEEKVMWELYHNHFMQTVKDKKTGKKTKVPHKRYPKRYKRISARFSNSLGSAPKKLSAHNLDYTVPPERIDGTLPRWFTSGSLGMTL